jgi:hypothetical protein
MPAVIVILSDSEDDCAQQQQRQHGEVVAITPSEPHRPAISAAAISSSSGAGNSSTHHSVSARSPLVIIPGTPPTPFSPDPIAPVFPLRPAAAEAGAGASVAEDLNCRLVHACKQCAAVHNMNYFDCSDDDFETKFLRCILPKPDVSKHLPRKHAAAPIRRQLSRKNETAKSKAALTASASAPAPVLGSNSAALSSHEAVEPAMGRVVHASVNRVMGGIAAEASDWDETEIARAIALSLEQEHCPVLGSNDDDASRHDIDEYAAADKELGARPGLGSQGCDVVHHNADDYDVYDEATLTGGCLPPSPGQHEDHATVVGGDDSILDISFQEDNLLSKPVSKRKARVPSAAAKQQQEKQQLEAVDDVDFTPAPKRSRARTASKAVAAKVARSEEDIAREQSDTLSRKSMTAAVKSARLGLLRPGLAAECRCPICRFLHPDYYPTLRVRRLHIFVDTGIAKTDRGTDIISAVQQVASHGSVNAIYSCQLQRFSAGNVHVTPCPVTRSIHLSRVNLTIGDGCNVEEIVEEELPEVIGRAVRF